MLDETPTCCISEHARLALEGTDTRQQAAERLLESAHQDPALYRALMAPMEMVAALRAVNSVVGSQRREVWTAPSRKTRVDASAARTAARTAAETAAQASSDRLRRAIRPNSYTLLDFKLPGTNLALRDAKRADLIEASAFYRQRADDAAHKARWLDAIAERVGRKRVGNALSESELERLQAEVAE